MTIDIDAVTKILREAAEEAVLPRFGALSEGDVMEKSPGQIVTVADHEAEKIITARLPGVVDAPVVGEEAVSTDPALLDALYKEPLVWLVDPVDGTRNFSKAVPEYAMMVALVREGRSVAAWILRPEKDLLHIAELGSGAWRGTTRLWRSPAPSAPDLLRGTVQPPDVRAHLSAEPPKFAKIGPGARCVGVEYPRLVEDDLDFALYRRTSPWDHAPGSLLLTEAGGVARRLEGDPYRPDDDRVGLLCASDPGTWQTARSLLPARNGC